MEGEANGRPEVRTSFTSPRLDTLPAALPPAPLRLLATPMPSCLATMSWHVNSSTCCVCAREMTVVGVGSPRGSAAAAVAVAAAAVAVGGDAAVGIDAADVAVGGAAVVDAGIVGVVANAGADAGAADTDTDWLAAGAMDSAGATEVAVAF